MRNPMFILCSVGKGKQEIALIDANEVRSVFPDPKGTRIYFKNIQSGSEQPMYSPASFNDVIINLRAAMLRPTTEGIPHVEGLSDDPA